MINISQLNYETGHQATPPLSFLLFFGGTDMLLLFAVVVWLFAVVCLFVFKVALKDKNVYKSMRSMKNEKFCKTKNTKKHSKMK